MVSVPSFQISALPCSGNKGFSFGDVMVSFVMALRLTKFSEISSDIYADKVMEK